MRLGILLGLAGTVVLLDFGLARLAERNARDDIENASTLPFSAPSNDTLVQGAKRTCQNTATHLIYRNQFCFVPYTSGEIADHNGWHLVYHRPKPFLSIIMPARHADSFYFRETVQGEYILFITHDGDVTYGDQR